MAGAVDRRRGDDGALWVGDGAVVGVAVAVALPVSVAEGAAVGVAVAEAVPVSVAEGAAVGVPVAVAAAVGVLAAVAAAVGVAVTEAVADAEAAAAGGDQRLRLVGPCQRQRVAVVTEPQGDHCARGQRQHYRGGGGLRPGVDDQRIIDRDPAGPPG